MFAGLNVTPRETGINKTAMKAMRARGAIPATLFGRSFTSTPVFINAKMATARGWHSGSMFTFSWDGKNYRATLNEIQREAVGSEITHLSFHVVKNDEMLSVDIPLRVKGRAIGERAGGLTNMLRDYIHVRGLPDSIPEAIEVAVDALELNDRILACDIALPPGLELAENNPEQIVINCMAPRKVDTVATVIETAPTEEPAP